MSPYRQRDGLPMPRAKRRWVPPTEEWAQLRLFVRSPEQELYETVRPIALFGRSIV
jgi:hypothetical protein